MQSGSLERQTRSVVQLMNIYDYKVMSKGNCVNLRAGREVNNKKMRCNTRHYILLCLISLIVLTPANTEDLFLHNYVSPDDGLELMPLRDETRTGRYGSSTMRINLHIRLRCSMSFLGAGRLTGGSSTSSCAVSAGWRS